MVGVLLVLQLLTTRRNHHADVASRCVKTDAARGLRNSLRAVTVTPFACALYMADDNQKFDIDGTVDTKGHVSSTFAKAAANAPKHTSKSWAKMRIVTHEDGLR